MTRQDHLLTIIAEECVETAQRATKALRFGLEEVQPGQDMSNAKRLMQEFVDLHSVIGMLSEHNDSFGKEYRNVSQEVDWENAKIEKVEHFLEYSAQQGRLDEEPRPIFGNHIREAIRVFKGKPKEDTPSVVDPRLQVVKDVLGMLTDEGGKIFSPSSLDAISKSVLFWIDQVKQ